MSEKFEAFKTDIEALCGKYSVKMVINQSEEIEILNDDEENRILSNAVIVDKTK